MANVLQVSAREGSTFGIRAEFFEITDDGEPGIPITPNEPLTWSLTDEDGNIVNGKENESLTPAPSVIIVLSGGDLALVNNYPVKRFVTIEGTYNSALGAGLPLVDEVCFQIENLKGV